MITGETHTKNYKGTSRTVNYIYYRYTKYSKTYRRQQLYTTQERLLLQINDLIQKGSLSQSEAQYFLKRIEEEEKEVTKERLVLLSKVEQELT